MPNPKHDFQQKFNKIAKEYDLISNDYAVKRRIESLNIPNSKLILETGSGSGLVTKSYNSKIICSDFSFEMCKQAKSRHKDVICCDAESLPFKEKIFDGVICAEMIYYLETPKKFILDSKKILKSNGVIAFSLPSKNMNTIDKIRKLLRNFGFKNMYFNDGIKSFTNIEILKSLLIQNGFRIIQIKKQIIFPFRSFDKINRILEKTIFKNFSMFFILHAQLED